MIGRGGVVVWEGGGLGQVPGDTGGIDPTQPVDTSASGALPIGTGTSTGITLSPGLTIPNPFASWGPGEWMVAVLGAFAVYAILHTAGQGVGTVKTWHGRRSARARKRRELEAEYAAL